MSLLAVLNLFSSIQWIVQYSTEEHLVIPFSLFFSEQASHSSIPAKLAGFDLLLPRMSFEGVVVRLV